MKIQVTDCFIGIESSDKTIQIMAVSMQKAVDGQQGYVDVVFKKPEALTGDRIRIGG